MNITRRTAIFAGMLALSLLTVLYVAVSMTSRAYVGQPVLVVSTPYTHQNEQVEIVLEGFIPRETVTLWQTFPDYTVLPLHNVNTDSAGNAVATISVDASQPLGQHAISARGNTSGTVVVGNFEIQASQAEPSPEASMTLIEVGTMQGQPYTFEGAGYEPSEPVSLWLTLPDGSVRDLKIVKASDGDFTYTFTPGPEDPAGTYFITGFGRSSEQTAIATFSVEPGDELEAAANQATLEVEPFQSEQLDVITLTGRGFEEGETIGLWMTLYDGTVIALYEGVTVTGAFQEQIYLPAVIPEGGLPSGHIDFSAYGKSSQRRAVTRFYLLPGSGF